MLPNLLYLFALSVNWIIIRTRQLWIRTACIFESKELRDLIEIAIFLQLDTVLFLISHYVNSEIACNNAFDTAVNQPLPW